MMNIKHFSSFVSGSATVAAILLGFSAASFAAEVTVTASGNVAASCSFGASSPATLTGNQEGTAMTGGSDVSLQCNSDATLGVDQPIISAQPDGEQAQVAVAVTSNSLTNPLTAGNTASITGPFNDTFSVAFTVDKADQSAMKAGTYGASVKLTATPN